MLKIQRWLLVGTIVIAVIAVAGNRKILGFPAEQVKACFPEWEGYFERSEFISQANDQQKDYYLIHLYQPQTEFPDLLVISLPVGGGDCIQEVLNITGDDISLSAALNNPQIGRQLTLELYQREIEKFGRESVQQHLNETAQSSSSIEWHEEDIWALQQLGFSIPKNVRAISVN